MIWHARLAGGAGSPPYQKQKRPMIPEVLMRQPERHFLPADDCGLSLGFARASWLRIVSWGRAAIHIAQLQKDNCELGSTSRLFCASANRTIPQKHAMTSGSLAYFSLLFLFLVPFCFFRHGGISLYRLVGLPHGRALLILGTVHVLFKSIWWWISVTFIEGRSAGEVHVRGPNNFAKKNQFAEVEFVRFTWHNKFR